MDYEDPDLKEWMLQIERRLSRVEAYMKVISGALTIALPTIIALLLKLLLGV